MVSGEMPKRNLKKPSSCCSLCLDLTASHLTSLTATFHSFFHLAIPEDAMKQKAHPFESNMWFLSEVVIP
jgi:hypothetical protein